MKPLVFLGKVKNQASFLLGEMRGLLAESSVQVTIAAALFVGCCLSTGLGIIGGFLGAIFGLACGVPLIPFTFGVSLPICSAVGAVIGFCSGMFFGWITGLCIGGILGHFGYANRHIIQSTAVCLVDSCRSWQTHPVGYKAEAHTEDTKEFGTKPAPDTQIPCKGAPEPEELNKCMTNLEACVQRMTTTEATEALSVVKATVFAILLRIEKQRRSGCWRTANDFVESGTTCTEPTEDADAKMDEDMSTPRTKAPEDMSVSEDAEEDARDRSATMEADMSMSEDAEEGARACSAKRSLVRERWLQRAATR